MPKPKMYNVIDIETLEGYGWTQGFWTQFDILWKDMKLLEAKRILKNYTTRNLKIIEKTEK